MFVQYLMAISALQVGLGEHSVRYIGNTGPKFGLVKQYGKKRMKSPPKQNPLCLCSMSELSGLGGLDVFLSFVKRKKENK